MIPDDKVKEVSERSPILDVVGEYVNLRRSGANYQGLCPFHGEKTPSFNVNPARNIFHCFGCGVGGNAFSFIMKMEGLSFPEAVKFLAHRAGIVIEERPLSAAEQRRQDERDALYRIQELSAQYFRNVLLKSPAGEPARSYLTNRGVTAATAEAYRLGFAPDKWDGLVRFLEQKRVPLDLAEKLGSIRRKASGGFIDLFRNRLIFTISDPQGRPIAFGARVLDASLPKYINSPESPIYRKSDVLFGVDLAKQPMREQNAAIVVEGYFDHLALYQADVRHVVATCGTAMTDGHLKLLKRYAGRVLTLFDSDAAGKKATFRAMDLMLGEDLPLGVIELPSGEDPDSFLRKEGAEAFSSRVAAARPALDFFFRDLLQRMDTGTVEGKVRLVDEVMPRLEKVKNDMERSLYLREFSRALGVDELILRKRLGKKPVTAADFAPSQRQQRRRIDTEEMLLALMAKYPEVTAKVAEYGVSRLFRQDLAPVAEAILDCSRSGGEINWDAVISLAGPPEQQGRLAAILMQDEQFEGVDPVKMFDELRVSRERNALKELDRLKRELIREEPGSERYASILREIDLLRNMKSQLL